MRFFIPGTQKVIQKMCAEFRSPACIWVSEWDWHYYPLTKLLGLSRMKDQRRVTKVHIRML